jgi:predicted nucleic acid-binding protein
MNKILVDSGILAAAYDYADVNSSRALEFFDEYGPVCLIPEVILTEVAFLLRRSGGVPAVATWTKEVATLQPLFQPLAGADLVRAGEIMTQYRDARLDFVDCCIMALSERLEITQIATVDHRDFSIFKPKHCDYLELLP